MRGKQGAICTSPSEMQDRRASQPMDSTRGEGEAKQQQPWVADVSCYAVLPAAAACCAWAEAVKPRKLGPPRRSHCRCSISLTLCFIICTSLASSSILFFLACHFNRSSYIISAEHLRIAKIIAHMISVVVCIPYHLTSISCLRISSFLASTLALLCTS
uniref:Uncharacterized protein n=1 Tax=Oryza brachyantha TaxID=4533 RepID=J3L455_ORYBR